MPDYVITSEEQRARLVRFISHLPLDKPKAVSISDYRKTRSAEQNRRHWLLMDRIAQQMPAQMDGVYYRPEMWHEYFCSRFLGTEVMEINGDSVPVRKPSRTLKTAEFIDLDDEIEAWMAEHEVYLDGAGL